MISPTGMGIRNDPEGSGYYAASRGSRRHNGVDYECVEGQEIIAPFDMTITRMSYPSVNKIMSGIAWKNGSSTGRMFYFEPDQTLIGKKVAKGDVIGVAQSIKDYYQLPKMKNHIHFKVSK